jgi:hypothetical protein
MTLDAILSIGYFILGFLYFWLYITRPYIAKKYVIRNNIQAQVESRRLFTDIDKVNLLAELMNDINFNNIIESKKEALIEKIIT